MSDTPAARTACVIAGATPDQVAAIGKSDLIALRPNKLGTLVTGRPGQLVIDYAADLPGPVYDVMYAAKTGWFSVTIYQGIDTPTRWDNRPGEDAGFPRVKEVLGATDPIAILDALDMPASVIGYAGA